jgi:PmbA protein
MIGKEKLFARLEKVLAKSQADESEVVYVGNQSGLTRYANSAIHQNVFEQNPKILFRSVLGKRVGVASTNSLVDTDLVQTMHNSLDIARNQPENRAFPGLPKPAKYRDIDTFDERTARFSPRDRARVVKKLITIADRKKFTLAGAFETAAGEVAVLNSKGVRAYQPFSSAAINIVAMSDTSSGFASGLSRRVDEIDFGQLGKTAVDKCNRSQNPRSIEPGEYEVILEPAAVAELLEWMNYIGFGSKSFLDKTSFLAGKIGRKVTSDQISIYDDGLDPNAIAFPFDFEGVPKRRVALIDKGIAKGVVYDSVSAVKGKTKSTGHALTPDESGNGTYALNLAMRPGKANRDKMIEKVKRGILVTRFHYINGFIDTPNAVLTGMTRDGTFFIEDGEVKYGIKNLRFTDGMLRSFATVQAISKETKLIPSWWDAIGCIKAPALHLGSFKFSGKTEF